MPVHDWTRVNAGIFHDFHHSWIEELKRTLNGGLLPPNYYALAEQLAGDIGPDVLTLEAEEPEGDSWSKDAVTILAVAETPPKVQLKAQTERDQYAQKQNSLVIRHSSGDRVVALVEIISPGNKSSRRALRSFVDKAAGALYHGYHLLIIDLQPPGLRDPQGIHGAIWEEIADASYRQPPDRPLTLAAYDAGPPKTAYVEPVAVGEVLIDMPLFLKPRHYISVPLQATYEGAWRTVPRRWRSVLETP